jgi:hypothetical protein
VELQGLDNESLIAVATAALVDLESAEPLDASSALQRVRCGVTLAAVGRLLTDRTMCEARERKIVTLQQLGEALGGASVQAVSNRLNRAEGAALPSLPTPGQPATSTESTPDES